MSNGDCPVGAKHEAEITGIMKQLDKYDLKQTYMCEQIEGIKKDLIDFKLTFKNWLIGLLVSLLMLLLGTIINIILTLAQKGG